jgi:hypothetical protein
LKHLTPQAVCNDLAVISITADRGTVAGVTVHPTSDTDPGILGFDEGKEAVAECVRHFEGDGAASDLISGALTDMDRELAVHAAGSCQFLGGESATPEFTMGATDLEPRCAARSQSGRREWVVQGVNAVRVIPHAVCEGEGSAPAPELVRNSRDRGRGDRFEKKVVALTTEVPGIRLRVEEGADIASWPGGPFGPLELGAGLVPEFLKHCDGEAARSVNSTSEVSGVQELSGVSVVTPGYMVPCSFQLADRNRMNVVCGNWFVGLLEAFRDVLEH